MRRYPTLVEAPDLPETVRKATLLVGSMVASAEAFAEPRPRLCNRRWRMRRSK